MPITAHDLITAANIFNGKHALTRAEQCKSLAASLSRFGSFKSEKQHNFALSLIGEADRLHRGESSDWGRPVPKFFAVMQRHAEFFAPVYEGEGEQRRLVGTLKIARRNQDSLCWLLWNDRTVGKIDNGRATVWERKAEAAGTRALAVLAIIEEFEKDPLETAKKYGRLSGRCCSCGRDLTNEGSIAAGIGPVCARKM